MITLGKSKRMKKSYEGIDREKKYLLDEALKILCQTPTTKFDETIELHFHLDIDLKNSEQIVRGTVILPNGTGKKIKIAVIAKGEQLQKAQQLGVEFAGAEDLIEKISKGFLDFDCMIASPDMMRDLSKVGRILGPRGLMPTPKAGTVSNDIEKAIKEVRAGKIEFKADKQGGIHVGVGKKSFGAQKLTENAKYLIDAISHAKPASVKGVFIKSLHIATTMGPGMRLVI